ncbi:methyl-accepting chemotaxis protein [Clostridium pascui]|uniref:methyl-accepting chemotaxis protein n=1 Tax=Clostridium pascui TaxID=46609 RepID=UPI00195DBF29|nr:methyl-accepting chemotaxis protein [Clostridium pascui]MBM7869693.1 methyl-accepting chemotaxis protein [Clostridium pascui]
MKKSKNNRLKGSIKNKLIFLLIGIIVIPIVTLALITYSNAKHVLGSEFKKNSMQMAEKLSSTIETYITENENNINMLSNNLNIRDVLNNKPEELLYTYNALQSYQEVHTDSMAVYIATHDKRLFVYPKVNLPKGFDPTARLWYQQAMKAGKMTWTEPYVDEASGKLTVTVAKPVRNSKGELIGVVGADISLDVLSKLVSETRLGKEGHFFIANSKGNILAHTDKVFNNKEIPVKDILDAVTSKKSDTIEYSYNGENNFAVFTTNNKTGWSIVGEMSYSEIHESLSVIFKVISIAGVIIIIIAAMLGMIFSKPMIISLHKLVKDMKGIGGGDLTIRSDIKSNDEIGILGSTLNSMSENLGELIKDINNISTEVTSAADSLASMAEESSASTEEITRVIGEVSNITVNQAKGTDMALSKIKDLSNSIQLVASAINDSKEIFDEVDSLNEKGIEVVQMLTQSTKENNDAAQKVSKVINEVDIKSDEIGSIIDTIEKIAAQTNLLALNASIEAARAGEAGRGFSVVADEVRKLAEQSKDATSKIRDLVMGIQSGSKNAVNTMEFASEIASQQSNAVVKTEDIFIKITNMVSKLSGEVEKIVKLNYEMTSKKDEIVGVMGNIAASSEQTSASTEEISASTEEQLAISYEVSKTSEELNKLSQKLNEKIESFKV